MDFDWILRMEIRTCAESIGNVTRHLDLLNNVSESIGAIQVVRSGGGGYQLFCEKTLRMWKVQYYLRYEGVGGVQFPEKSIT